MKRLSIVTGLAPATVILGLIALPGLVSPPCARAAGGPSAQAASDAIIVDADTSVPAVNVMGRALPKLPAVPHVTRKPGVVRGFVTDAQGHPLRGAVIGVRSSAIGGAYSGASAKSDARGYYEIAVPWGAAEFYCAGYAVDYGDGIAALGLCPADGETDGFATAGGAVKNWVLLPYGVADRAGAQDNPKYPGNYYGGTVTLAYQIDSDSSAPDAKALPPGSRIEVTLTPDGSLIDGSRGRILVVRQTVATGMAGSLSVNNIPVGRYRIGARLDGKTLRLKEIGFYRSQPFGLAPKEATGEATLLLKSEGAKPGMVTAAHGNWQDCEIALERP